MIAPSRLAALDGLRGVAAIGVFASHIIYFFGLSPAADGPLVTHLYLLVDCFFVLSGFVIARSFDPRIAAGMTTMQFMRARLVRLYPMIVLGVAVGALPLLAYWRSHPGVGLDGVFLSLVSGLLVMPTRTLMPYINLAFPANSAHWSLSFELLLCLLYAGWARHLRGRMMTVVTLVALLAMAGTAFVGHGLDIGFQATAYHYGASRSLYPFLAGMMLARSAIVARSSSRFGYAGVLLMVVVVVNPLPASWAYDACVSAFIWPLVVWLAASAKPNGTLDRLSLLGGKISYPLYAIHFPIVLALANGSAVLGMTPGQNLALAVWCFVSTPLLAYSVHQKIDVPVRRILGARLVGRALARGESTL